MPRLELGIAAACGASVLYDVAIAFQALEARVVSREHSLRPSLLTRLLRRPRWVGATLLGILGWPLQLTALVLAPLTVVQPALAAGLLLLLVLGVRLLGERAGRREILAVLAIVAGVGGMAWAAPEHTTSHAAFPELELVLGGLAALAIAPYLALRVGNVGSLVVVLSAGCAYAWSGLSSKLLTDEFAAEAWLPVLLWVIATALVAGLGLLSEMTALQRRPATQVAPIVFVVQMVLPVLFAPVLGGESWSSTPLDGVALILLLAPVAGGAAALGSSPAVAALISSTHEQAPLRSQR